MFDLIEQAEHYPQFMPWCVGATILERSDDWVAGKVDFSFFELRFSFVTRNAKRRPDGCAFASSTGRFAVSTATGCLTPLGELGSKVEFDVAYEIGDVLLDRLARPPSTSSRARWSMPSSSALSSCTGRCA
jgi:ribosome-associated toxin RatA of RatAB toxin-antitoxin module